MKFKMRAECQIDVTGWLSANPENRVTVWHTGSIQGMVPIPDVEVEFESPASTADLVAQMAAVTDGHVMAQTVQPVGKYTGERDPERSELR